MTSDMDEEDDLPTAASKNDLLRIKELLAEGYDIDWHRKRGKSALWEASSEGHFELVKFLVENGADVNIGTYDSDGDMSALHIATDNHHYDIVKYLLEKGAAPDDYDSVRYRTPLMQLLVHYTEQKHEEIYRLTKLLLEYGADVDWHFSGEPSAKELIMRINNAEIIELIRDK